LPFVQINHWHFGLACGIYTVRLALGGERNRLNGLTFNDLTDKFMSQHRSLRAAATLGGKRNVLKRFERTELLKKRGQWKDGDRITGLRKTKPEA
jgi:small basic protein (TIGR04137 family)